MRILLLRTIKNRYNASKGLRKIAHNISWLFFDKIFRMGVGLIVGVWIARYLGPQQFGLWNYAISLTSLFGAFATLGLDNIVIRDIVKDPSQRYKVLGNAFFLKFIAGIAILIVTVAIIYVIKKDRLSLYLVALSSMGFVFQSFNVIDLYFQSQIRSKFAIYARNSAFFIVSLFKVFLLLTKAPLILFALAGAIEIVLCSAFLILSYTFNHLPILVWKFNAAVSKKLLADSWPLMLSALAISTYMNIDQVMIGQMLGNREVGIYSVAVKISEIWYFVPVAIVGSLFPTIIETKKRSAQLYDVRIQKLYNLMTWLGIFVAVIFSFSSAFIIHVLYGINYVSASPILSLHIWAGIAVCLGVASNNWLIAENLQKYGFYRTIQGAVINVVLNFLLLPKFGSVGAAIATVVSYFYSVFGVIFFNKTRKTGFMMLKSFLLK